MQVVTLNDTALDRHAERLAGLVEGQAEFRPDAIVAVRRGGSFVCDAFCRHYSRPAGARFDITLQRPSTRRKSGLLGQMLRYLPLPVLDLMRMAESYVLSMRRRKSPPDLKAELPDGLERILRNEPAPGILIIDDAIDSGDTLYTIVSTLKGVNPTADIRIAVMTETTRSPRIHADYALYRDRTLIRFPWSSDYRIQ